MTFSPEVGVGCGKKGDESGQGDRAQETVWCDTSFHPPNDKSIPFGNRTAKFLPIESISL